MKTQILANSKVERSSGRPQDTEQGALKDLIMNSAEDLFANQGFAAASVRQIADTAGVNSALIHYYFGNKKKLLQQVMQRAFTPLRKGIASLSESNSTSIQEISRLFQKMATKNPNLPKLMVREVFLPGGEMREFFIENMAPQLGGAIPTILSGEKEAGRLRQDFDPAVAALLLLAVSLFPFLARDVAEPVLGLSYKPAGLKTLDTHISGLLERGMLR